MMSDDKSTGKQFTQDSQPQRQIDVLDAQYKSIGISAVSAAAGAMKGPKVKKPIDQWS
jgi:hypothetical protein